MTGMVMRKNRADWWPTKNEECRKRVGRWDKMTAEKCPIHGRWPLPQRTELENHNGGDDGHGHVDASEKMKTNKKRECKERIGIWVRKSGDKCLVCGHLPLLASTSKNQQLENDDGGDDGHGRVEKPEELEDNQE